jgi:hypothetical protein
VLQLRNREIIRPDAIQRRQPSAEYVVEAAEFTGALDGSNVRCFLDRTDDCRITSRIAADGAERFLSEIEALGTRTNFFGQSYERVSEPAALIRGLLQEMVGEPERSLPADAWKLGKL